MENDNRPAQPRRFPWGYVVIPALLLWVAASPIGEFIWTLAIYFYVYVLHRTTG